MTAQALLSVQGLVKRFGGLLATDAVTLTVNAGEVHAIIGPNGAGKTTLIGQLTGELRPDAGSVHLLGTDVSTHSVAQRAHAGLGRSYQISQICKSFTALENVMLAVQSRQGSCFRFWHKVATDDAVRVPAINALTRLGLGHKAHTLAADMAHGEHRQLELAMTLALQPKVLLLDEPMAGMSHSESAEMIPLIAHLKTPEGGSHGILLVEHDMDAVFALADRISVLVYGRIIATGSPDDIRNNPEVRTAYLGEDASL